MMRQAAAFKLVSVTRLNRGNIMKLIKITLSAFALLALSGCATTSAVESDFGNSVRNMVQAQQAHPDVSANPSPDAVDGTDGERAKNVLRTYREDVTTKEEVDRPISVSIGRNRN